MQHLLLLLHGLCLVQFSALQDITITPPHTAVFVVPWELIKGSLDRTTVSPARGILPQTLMAPQTLCSAKVCVHTIMLLNVSRRTQMSDTT